MSELYGQGDESDLTLAAIDRPDQVATPPAQGIDGEHWGDEDNEQAADALGVCHEFGAQELAGLQTALADVQASLALLNSVETNDPDFLAKRRMVEAQVLSLSNELKGQNGAESLQ